MVLVDYIMFFWAVFLIIVGLLFEASGFGIIVAGRLDGIILVIMGISIFWGGWIMSQARGFWFALAATLNMFDAASTVAFWNFEINPIVLSVGPTVFMLAKITSSLTIMLYAKLNPESRTMGKILAVLFSIVVAWNLSQHFFAYIGVKESVYGVLVGAIISFMLSAIILYTLLKTKASRHAGDINARAYDRKFFR